MDGAVTAAIGVAGTLAGTGLGFAGALSIARRERRHVAQRERRQAFATYLGVLYATVAELRELPPVRQAAAATTMVDRVRGEGATFVHARRREHAVFGDRLRELAERVAIALAALQVMALPTEVRAACDAAADYIERLATQRSPEIKAEWSTIYEQIHAAAPMLGPNE